MSKLDGKVALITGSGRGIGRAISLKLAGAGARVVVNDLDEAPAAETLAEVEALGGVAIACNGDVTANDFPERFVGAAIERFGGLDILVNNAGYTRDGVIQKMSDDQWQAMLDIHMTAPFRILRAAADFIRGAAKAEAAKGQPVHRKVVNISSLSGVYGNAGQANYAAAKSGVIGLTKTMAKEWGRYCVNVNCVAFGPIETRLTVGETDAAGQVMPGMPPEALEALIRAIPLGRAGTPEEAAGAVYLLCLPEADFITGQTLEVSGGLVF